MLTGPPGHYEAFRHALYAKVLESPGSHDLADRTRAVTALRDELAEIRSRGRGLDKHRLRSPR